MAAYSGHMIILISEVSCTDQLIEVFMLVGLSNHGRTRGVHHHWDLMPHYLQRHVRSTCILLQGIDPLCTPIGVDIHHTAT